MKTTYEERAIKFITNILAPIIAEGPAFKQAIRRYNRTHKVALKTDSGYTRTVIIRSDYVVKITHNSDDEFGDNRSEVEAYKFAEQAGYGYLFAKATLFRVEGLDIDFEIMPRVKHGINNTDKFYWNYLTRDELQFLNNNFGDLHCGNLGYYKGKPVFIDYACRDLSYARYYL